MSGMLPLRDTDPREVSGYRLLGRLGEGGQGVVFLALSSTGPRAAVKLLAPTTDPRVRSRFLKEVAAAQQVAGFCTAQVLDAGIFERRPFIVTEYVSGPSLVEVVQQHGPRSHAVLERIAVATLTALGAAHAVGMVHRDFKPGNVLLGPDGPVVIDFGLAAVPGMTTTGMSGQVAVGTPAFMAPEQLAGTRVTAAADMWAWAVTIAFTGTGELPFKGESLTATAYAILHAEPSVGQLPEPLGSLVRRCLNKDPASRPSARDALSEMAAAGARLLGPLPARAAALPVDDAASSTPPVPATPFVPAAPLEPRQGGDDGLAGARQAAGSTPVSESMPDAGQEPVRHGDGGARRRWRAVAAATSVLLIAGIGVTAFMLTQAGSSPPPAGGRPGTSPAVRNETKVRAQAVAWILRQVSRSSVVGCDAQVCNDLAKGKYPVAGLLTIGPQTNDPLGTTLVVATSTVRAQYGARLASVYAPAVIASFGSGNDRIDILLTYPGGSTAYSTQAPAAAHNRRIGEAQLLTNSRLKFSPTARAELRGGGIDPRLPLLLATIAQKHPVQIVDFGDRSPGGGPASLLRSMDLATPDPAAHLTSRAFFRYIHRLIKVQWAQFLPALSQVQLPTGQTVLRIQYGAPSPLACTGPGSVIGTC
jgi:serine/threonine protein kinase